MEVNDMTEILQISEAYVRIAREAGIVPREMNAAQVQAIVLAGRELGLEPLQSLRTMSFVNGRLCMAVQLQLALARQRAGVQIEQLEETDTRCTVTLRRGEERVTCTYTMDDAKRAGIDRQNNWQKYPRQMLRWRAIGDALRIIAPDVVMGLLAPEEAETITVEPVPVPPEALPEPEPEPEPEPQPEPQPATTSTNANGANGANGDLLLRELRAQNPVRYRQIIARLQLRARQVFGEDEARRRQYLQQEYGVSSFVDLTVHQAQEVYNKLGEMLPQTEA
jgi:hypothetical protein